MDNHGFVPQQIDLSEFIYGDLDWNAVAENPPDDVPLSEVWQVHDNGGYDGSDEASQHDGSELGETMNMDAPGLHTIVTNEIILK